ncbi:TetR family transcriptional regulator [Wenjunlia vitaminophila]|uniref:TetR family transcriptional regulator n=1 Tax=Wenjunlia vitaminophila TaxID=76728 RepID=A0A0T6LNZ6_WENVI|nr:TetR/AcrR family transcriptional regulator [Wenjunlia vitaminophila]KRV47688.1 TetR family transcriptional regulator [Wenjunlia vitaminophila]
MQPAPARTRILDAAERLLRTVGLAHTTTKEIARAADCSEAALYKHFSSKEDLFVQVLEERLPRLGPLLAELSVDPGQRTVQENLVEIVRHAVLFYESSTPIAGSLFAEPALLRRHREGLHRLNAGPHRPLEALATYLRIERAAGRVHREADPVAAASLVLGACFQRAFLHVFSDEPYAQPLDVFATDLARTVLAGIAPRPATTGQDGDVDGGAT